MGVFNSTCSNEDDLSYRCLGGREWGVSTLWDPLLLLSHLLRKLKVIDAIVNYFSGFSRTFKNDF